MQIEMTPYGRYLYSIGKFKPHSYEFVDDDIVYRMPNSGETQEAAQSRILNETPKLKINRAFQDEAPVLETPATISDMRVMTRKMDQRQSNIYPMGRSAYSGSNIPLMQATMLQGSISGSTMTHTVVDANPSGIVSNGGQVFIPQVDVDFNFTATLRSILEPLDDYEGSSVQSSTFEDGTYIDIRYTEPIIHLKEFNSFYEKENFEIEVFKISHPLISPASGQVLTPLKMNKMFSSIVNGLLIDRDVDPVPTDLGFPSTEQGSDFVDYFFEIQVDSEIPVEELCKAINSLEVNSQFLDEELICPDQRTDRFDIYSTRVSPEDLEDCD